VFPLIFYGRDEWGDHASAQAPTFLVQVSSLCSPISDVAYSFSGPTIGGDIDILYDKYLIPNQTYTGGPDGALNVAVTLLQFHLWPRREHVKNIAEPVGRTMSPPP
jgi:hypothetical protein